MHPAAERALPAGAVRQVNHLGDPQCDHTLAKAPCKSQAGHCSNPFNLADVDNGCCGDDRQTKSMMMMLSAIHKQGGAR